MGYISLIILLALFSWLVYRNFFKTDLSKRDLLFGWLLKLGYGFFFMWLMTFYFSPNNRPMGDVGNFLHDSEIIHSYAQKNPGGYLKLLIGLNADDPALMSGALKETSIWDYGITSDNLNDNRFIIRLNSLIRFISFGNYWVHVLFFCFLSFSGIILLYRVFSTFVSRKKMLFYALLGVPTIAFWGSGITKETIFILGAGVFFFGVSKLLTRITWHHVLIVLSGIWLLLINKPHVGLIIIPMTFFLIVGRRREFGRKAVLISSFAVISGITILCYTPPQINLVNRISNKQQDFINLAKGGVFFVNDTAFCAFDYADLDHFEYDTLSYKISATESSQGEYKPFGEKIFKPFTIQPSDKWYDVYLVVEPSETYVETEPIQNSPLQLLKNTPSSLFNVLVRPLPSDTGSSFKYFSFTENLVFLGFMVLVLFQRKKISSTERVWVFYFIASAIILILIIGWTTPITGAVVRYKIAPYLLLLLATFICWKEPKTKST